MQNDCQSSVVLVITVINVANPRDTFTSKDNTSQKIPRRLR